MGLLDELVDGWVEWVAIPSTGSCLKMHAVYPVHLFRASPSGALRLHQELFSTRTPLHKKPATVFTREPAQVHLAHWTPYELHQLNRRAMNGNISKIEQFIIRNSDLVRSCYPNQWFSNGDYPGRHCEKIWKTALSVRQPLTQPLTIN